MKWSGGFDLRAYQEGPESAWTWIGEAWVGGTRLLSVRGAETKGRALDDAQLELLRGPHAKGPIHRPTGEIRVVAICAPFGREIEVASWFPTDSTEQDRRAAFSSFVRFKDGQ